MKKVLITGGTGFIGHNLVKEFLKDYKVVCLVRPGSKNLDRLLNIYGKVEFVNHNIREPLPNIQDIDIILHAGANPSAADSINDPVGAVTDNVIGTVNLLEFARKANVKKFVYYSSGEVFGPIPIGHDSYEDDRYNSNSPYAASKAAGEELCVAYSKSFNLPISIIHINNTFGPMCQANRFPVIALSKILKDEPISIHVGPGGIVGGRRWFHAEDVALHTRFILDNQTEICEKWNSAGSKFISNADLARNIANIVGKEVNIEYVPVDRPGHDLCFSVDPSKLYNKGWVEPMSIEARLKETIDWYLANPAWLSRN
jgi:dTDP-glucose 4,6-dehydratase